MYRLFSSSILLFAVCLLSVSAARAQNAAAGPVKLVGAAERPAGRFSLGAGVGMSFTDNWVMSDAAAASAGTGFPVAVGAPSRVPYGTALLEMKVTDRFRAGLGVSGYYSNTENSSEHTPMSPSLPTRTSYGFASTLSARWIVNPGGIVEVSPIVALGGYRSSIENVPVRVVADSDQTVNWTTSSATGKGVVGRVGLVLEHELLAQLFLRFESYFVSASYGRLDSFVKQDGPNPKAHAKEVAVTGGFTPSLQLRLAF